MDGTPDLPQPDTFGEATEPVPQSDEFGAVAEASEQSDDLVDPTDVFAPPSEPATTPFSPPTTGPAMAFSQEAPISVVLEDKPKRRRTGLFVGVGVLALAALGVGAFLLTRGDDKKTYSLEAATAAAAEQDATSFEIAVETMGEEITMDVQIDNISGIGHIVMNLGAAVGGDIEMILDTKGETAYMSSGFFESIGLEIDTPWIRMDKQFFEDSSSSSVFDTASNNGALTANAVFDNAKSVEDLGIEEIDGEKLKHYRVTIDSASAIKALPELEDQFSSIDGELPDELVYEMYVTEDNILRKLTVNIDVGPTEINTEMTIKDLDEPLVVEIPSDDDVTDAADLF